MLEYLYFEEVTSPFPRLLEGIDTGWGRILGGAPITGMVDPRMTSYDMQAPERSVAALVAVRQLSTGCPIRYGRSACATLTDDLLMDVTGTVLEAMATAPQVVVNDPVDVNLFALTRSVRPCPWRVPTWAARPIAPTRPTPAIPRRSTSPHLMLRTRPTGLLRRMATGMISPTRPTSGSP